MTQQEFSDMVGVSRSALANYETGRSSPNVAVLRDIAKAMGVPETHLTMASALDVAEDSASLGLSIKGDQRLTEDELAIVRLLRLGEPKAVSRVLDLLIKALAQGNAGSHISDFMHLKDDLARADAIIKDGGFYDKGHMITEDQQPPKSE